MSPEERAHAVVRPWTNIAAWRRRHLIEDIAAAIRAAVAEERERAANVAQSCAHALGAAAVGATIAKAIREDPQP